MGVKGDSEKQANTEGGVVIANAGMTFPCTETLGLVSQSSPSHMGCGTKDSSAQIKQIRDWCEYGPFSASIEAPRDRGGRTKGEKRWRAVRSYVVNGMEKIGGHDAFFGVFPRQYRKSTKHKPKDGGSSGITRKHMSHIEAPRRCEGGHSWQERNRQKSRIHQNETSSTRGWV